MRRMSRTSSPRATGSTGRRRDEAERDRDAEREHDGESDERRIQIVEHGEQRIPGDDQARCGGTRADRARLGLT